VHENPFLIRSVSTRLLRTSSFRDPEVAANSPPKRSLIAGDAPNKVLKEAPRSSPWACKKSVKHLIQAA
jgi:hypothetical protein